MLQRKEMKDKLKKAMRVYFCVDDFKKDSNIFHIGCDALSLFGKFCLLLLYIGVFAEFQPVGLFVAIYLIAVVHILAGQIAICFRQLKFLLHLSLTLLNIAEEIISYVFFWEVENN